MRGNWATIMTITSRKDLNRSRLQSYTTTFQVRPATLNALLIFTLKGNQLPSDLHVHGKHESRGEAQQACTGSDDQAGTDREL